MSECKCRIVFGHTVSAASARIERCDRCKQDRAIAEKARECLKNKDKGGWSFIPSSDPWDELWSLVRASLPQEQKDDE